MSNDPPASNASAETAPPSTISSHRLLDALRAPTSGAEESSKHCANESSSDAPQYVLPTRRKLYVASPNIIRVTFEADPNLQLSSALSSLNLEHRDGAWYIPFDDYTKFESRVTGKPTRDPPPPWVLRVWSASAPKATDPQIRYIDGIMEYQMTAVRFALDRAGRCIIGDEMGLGKTITALNICLNYEEEWPCLVICPSILRHQWKQEIIKWLHLESDRVQIITKGRDSIIDISKFVIVSYDLLSRNEKFTRMPDGTAFRVIICDECHSIKNGKAKRTKVILPMMHNAIRAILLSGTPALNNSSEMYTQLKAVIGEHIMPDFFTFANRYAYREFNEYSRGYTYNGVRHPKELRVLMSSVMIRRRKKHVLKELPPMRRIVVTVLPDNKKILNNIMNKVKNIKDITPDMMLMTCSIKIKSTCEYVQYLLESSNQKMLLFAYHHDMLNGLEKIMNTTKHVRIDGNTPQSRRPDMIRSFQEDKDVRVAMLSITACGTGLNLTAASLVIFCELYWVPGVLEQCEARAHRIGQSNTLDVHYIIVEDSPDTYIFDTIGYGYKL